MIFQILWILIHIVVIFFLTAHFFMLAVSLLFGKKNNILKNYQDSESTKKYDFACIITAYKNVEIGLALVDSLLKQTYNNYEIYLVADECEIDKDFVLDKFQKEQRVKVLIPEEKLGGKVMSMRYAVESFEREHEAIIIFDPDNLVRSDFLNIMNVYFNRGYKAVQGKRTAKNLNTVYACLDALNETYYNYINRLVLFRLGASACISGSGMAIDAGLFKSYLFADDINEKIARGEVIVAEDNILQNKLVVSGLQIAFAHEALVYDEKVTQAKQVSRQRTRWLYAYFKHLTDSLKIIGQGIISLKPSLFLFGFVSIFPPIILLFLSSSALLFFDLLILMFYKDISPVLPLALLLATLVFTGNMLWVLYLDKAPKEIWKALWGSPLFAIRQLKALTQLNKAKKDFMETKHTTKNVSLKEVVND